MLHKPLKWTSTWSSNKITRNATDYIGEPLFSISSNSPPFISHPPVARDRCRLRSRELRVLVRRRPLPVLVHRRPRSLLLSPPRWAVPPLGTLSPPHLLPLLLNPQTLTPTPDPQARSAGVRSSAAGVAPTGLRSPHVTMKNRRTPSSIWGYLH
jgi:hypothetical protein